MIQGLKWIRRTFPDKDGKDYQPDSLDLRLKKICKIATVFDEGVVGLYNNSKVIPKHIDMELEKEEHFGTEGYILEPFSSYIAVIDGKMEIPQGICQFYLPRSSLLRCGVSLDTALGDTGFKGTLKFLIRNNSQNPVFLAKGERIATCVNFEVKNAGIYSGDYNEY